MPANSGGVFASSLLLTPDEVQATVEAAPPSPRPVPMIARRPSVRRARPAWLLEAALVTAITALAAVLRFFRLDTIPFGLHGDEATVGNEAARILREGAIGPYSDLAMGQPAGPIYFTALAVRFLGHTVLAVRIVPALAGVLTVLALYFVMRRAFGIPTALVGATLLATLGWHVHYARIGFPLETWPLCAILTAGALMEAIRWGAWRWWIGTGVLAGLSLYSYNAATLFLALLGLFVGLWVLWELPRGQYSVGRLLGGPALLAVTFAVLSWPMVAYATAPQSSYFTHAQAVSIFARPEWTALEGPSEQARFLADRYTGYWQNLCCSKVIDGVDASGTIPLVPLGVLLLAAVGVLLGCFRSRHPLTYFGLLIVLLLPIAAVATLDGFARRTFASAPFLAMFAALPLGWLLESRPLRRWAMSPRDVRLLAVRIGVVLAILGLIGAREVTDYFGKLAPSQEAQWVFGVEMADAANYLRTLPDASYVYFLSERWPLDHEVSHYLTPEIAGEDRSVEYGKRTDLSSERTTGTLVYLFIGRYTELVDEVETRYPQGTLTVGTREGRQTFVAYRVDLGATAGR